MTRIANQFAYIFGNESIIRRIENLHRELPTSSIILLNLLTVPSLHAAKTRVLSLGGQFHKPFNELPTARQGQSHTKSPGCQICCDPRLLKLETAGKVKESRAIDRFTAGNAGGRGGAFVVFTIHVHVRTDQG
jgi:hypothetical protein